MRSVFAAGGALAIALVAGTSAARSQDAQWCMELDPYTRSCAFPSYQQCAEAAKDAAAMYRPICTRNAQYQPPAAPPRRGKNGLEQGPSPRR